MFLKLLCLIIIKLLQRKTMRRNIVVCKSDYTADVSVTSDIPIPCNKSASLSNQRNKQSLVNILGRLLERNGITVVHAKDMGDADVTIIKETLTLAEVYKCVQVVAYDTDIFICLLFHSTQDTDIIMRTKGDCINVRKVQESLGKSLCFWLRCNFFFLWHWKNESRETSKRIRSVTTEESSIW